MVPQVMSVLEQVDPETEGELPPAVLEGIRPTVPRIRIERRRRLVGPCFAVPAAGSPSFGDPVLELVRTKS